MSGAALCVSMLPTCNLLGGRNAEEFVVETIDSVGLSGRRGAGDGEAGEGGTGAGLCIGFGCRGDDGGGVPTDAAEPLMVASRRRRSSNGAGDSRLTILPRGLIGIDRGVISRPAFRGEEYKRGRAVVGVVVRLSRKIVCGTTFSFGNSIGSIVFKFFSVSTSVPNREPKLQPDEHRVNAEVKDASIPGRSIRQLENVIAHSQQLRLLR